MSGYHEVEMKVEKRDGSLENISFDKILARGKKLGDQKNLNVTYSKLVMKVIDQLYDGIPTSKIDELTAEQCATLSTHHLDYGTLGARVIISNYQKNTDKVFYNVMEALYNHRDVNNIQSPLISKKIWEIVKDNKEKIENMLVHERDFLIDYFGFKTLERAYLMKIKGKSVERIQHMWMRVSLQIHETDFEMVKKTYDMLSQKYFIHATPTLFNAGTPRPQLSSCFLLAMENDSIDGIYNTLKECAQISKWAGGIGLHIHNIRATGSQIRGTNGTSNGVVPMLRVFNDTARYVDQCVIPETYIYTTQGPKMIQNVIPNETAIFNSNGKAEIVENVLEHSYDGPMLKINTLNSIEPLEITPEHPVYVLRGQKKGLNYSVIKNRLDHKTVDFEWIEANKLTCDDMLVYTVPEYEKDITNISNDDCYIYGVLLGDGYMHNEEQNAHITVHSIAKKDIIDFCENYFSSRCIRTIKTVEDNTTRIRWNKTTILPFKYNDIYDEQKEKRIQYRWLNLPLVKAKYIVKGLIDSDGCKHKELVFDSTSRTLIEGLRYLLLRMGVPTSGYIRDRVGEKHETSRGIIENKKISYCLRIPKTQEICELVNIENQNQFNKYMTYGNKRLTRISSINEDIYSGTLYDLQMTSVHDYTIHNGIVHNGGGKRNGSFAIYLETWHADIFEFLDLKKNHGDEEMRARDLFYAMWIPSLFMEKVEKNEEWYLFCPDVCKILSDVYGEQFNKIYQGFVNENKFVKKVNARELWFKILDSQMETGTPYLLYKDACNEKSNQKNLGTIKSSNLCCEIVEYSDENETAVCNLASIGLSSFVKPQLISNNELIIYSKTDCIYCKLAKGLFKKNNLFYTEINLDDNEYRQKVYKEIANKTKKEINTVPQIFSGDIYIGGFMETKDYLKPFFDFNALQETAMTLTDNLNKIIDCNYYPNEKTRRSNYRHRPIGIGVQGLADVFAMMDIPFESDEAKQLNSDIFETIYFGALCKSNDIATKRAVEMRKIQDMYLNRWFDFETKRPDCHSYIYYQNIDKIKPLLEKYKPIYDEITNIDDQYIGSYSTFKNSPASKGILQFDMWGITPKIYDWDLIKNKIMETGLRNSLLVAPMPTASTSQILGNNECFEPFTSNIYTRRTLAGEFIVVNKHLMKDLLMIDMWSEEMKNAIIEHKGSVQHIENIPKFIKEKYKISWEISMKNVIDMARDRGAFICQSQSMNLWMEDPTYKTLTSMHFYAWKQGLKTGIYYLRRKPKHQAQQFTIVPKSISDSDLHLKSKTNQVKDDDEGCLACSG